MGCFFKQETVIANPVPISVIANPEVMKQSQAFEVKQSRAFEVVHRDHECSEWDTEIAAVVPIHRDSFAMTAAARCSNPVIANSAPGTVRAPDPVIANPEVMKQSQAFEVKQSETSAASD